MAPSASLTEHVDEQKLGDISVAELDVFFFECRSDSGTLLGNHTPLLGCCLARPHRPNELTQLDRHNSACPVSPFTLSLRLQRMATLSALPLSPLYLCVRSLERTEPAVDVCVSLPFDSLCRNGRQEKGPDYVRDRVPRGSLCPSPLVEIPRNTEDEIGGEKGHSYGRFGSNKTCPPTPPSEHFFGHKNAVRLHGSGANFDAGLALFPGLQMGRWRQMDGRALSVYPRSEMGHRLREAGS